jgi:dihydrofolate reductase
MPWKSQKDMQFFFKKTINNVVIMGKNTYFTLPEKSRPLKDRLNIILTSNPDYLIFKK